MGETWETVAFRLTILVSLAALLTFMAKVLAAVRGKAKMEQRVQTHLDKTEPLIDQFQEYRRMATTNEVRHAALVERLDRFVETQDEANKEFRRGIDWLMREKGGGSV